MKQKIVVIGGGASGFFAAINIANALPNAAITILEKTNQLLTKVKVSGGGRCNVTHAEFDPKELSINYPRGEREFLGPFNYFAPGDTIAWFAERGIELKIEDDGRMFPTTDSSQTIIDCFLNEAAKHNIQIKTSTEVISISKNDHFNISCKNGKTYEADQVIVGVGGNPKLKHYSFIEELGHIVLPPIPSLFTFNLPKHPLNKLMGLSFPVTVNLINTPYEESGPLLITHWGMSGPAILKLSARAAKYLHEKNYNFDFSIAWLEGAEDFISDKRKHNGASKILKSKINEMPQRLWEYLVGRANISPSTNWADLKKNEIEVLSQVLQQDAYTAHGKTTFKEEFVTSGGIDLKEINLKRMESKKIPGLFFCGEVMNVDAVTGGFNFQAAWTSAFLVCEAIAQNQQS